jgi:lipid A 3-O-deacylase
MKKAILFLFFIILLLSAPSHADERKKPGDLQTLTYYMENDVVRETDRQYTNGIKLTWISEDLSNYRNSDKLPEWACCIVDRLPFIHKETYQKNISFSIGQNIYTPDDISRTDLIKDDRPYAGITYFAVGFISKNTSRMDTIEIDMGIIGPHSYAGKVQDNFHEWFDRKRPKGWDNQLKDEPILNFFYERKWRVLSGGLGNGYSYDIIPYAGFSMGNLLVAADAGSMVRFGLNMPNDFGTLLIRPGSETNAPVDDNDPRLSGEHSPFSVHMFLGVDAFAVARNILLDGNTFNESHSVKKKPFVCRFSGGIGFIIGRTKITYSNVYETKSFYKQKSSQSYGSLTVSYSY